VATAVFLYGVLTVLQGEMFLEDYRYKDMCTRRQRNMDSAFENLCQTVQQGSFSSTSSVAGTSIVEMLISVPEFKIICHYLLVLIISELNFLHVTFSLA
jgi:hypothetical protein